MSYPIYAVALGGVVLYFVVSTTTSYITAVRFKKAHGCEPENKMPQAERIIGYGLFRNQKQARKENRLTAVTRERFRDNGTTYSSVILGMKVFNTVDPENIKAILATNFSDFGLGKRHDSFGSLLGSGIFTTDGAAWEHSRVRISGALSRDS
jgi:hypothetical protein